MSETIFSKKKIIAPIQLSNKDESAKREKIYNAIEKLHFHVNNILNNESETQRQEIFLELILIKLYSDRFYPESSVDRIWDFDNYIFFTTDFYSKFPFIKNGKTEKIDKTFFQNIKTFFSDLKFNNINLSISSNNSEEVIADYALESKIFDNYFEIEGLIDIILDILNISENDSIFTNDTNLFLFRRLFLNNSSNKVYIPQEYFSKILKSFFIYSLIYKLNIDYKLPNISSIENKINNENNKTYSIFLLKDENYFNFSLVDLNQRTRGFIGNISDCFLPNQILNEIIISMYFICNINYCVFAGSDIKFNNGLFFQKEPLYKKKIINVLQNYFFKIGEKKSSIEKQKYLNVSFDIYSQTDIQKQSINDLFLNFNPVEKSIPISEKYFGNLNLSSKTDIDILRRALNDFLLESLDINEFYKDSIFNPENINEFSTTQDFYFQNPNMEIQILSKSEIYRNKIMHPYYFNKYFVSILNELRKESNIEFGKLCNIFNGSEIEGNLSCEDNILLDRENYTGIINNDCIRKENFIDLSKIKFIQKNTVSAENLIFLKTNDILLTFHDVRNNSKISYVVLPAILDGFILGKETIAMRAISERIKPEQIISFIEMLKQTKLINQLSYFIKLQKRQLNNDIIL